ncbi:40S ribosomal protein S20, partial [Galemys pyrenaicus]
MAFKYTQKTPAEPELAIHRITITLTSRNVQSLEKMRIHKRLVDLHNPSEICCNRVLPSAWSQELRSSSQSQRLKSTFLR